MASEIERKFLVASDAWRLAAEGSHAIRQGYLGGNDRSSIRVRIVDHRTAMLTIKSRGAELRRLEFEYEIPVIEAEALLTLCMGAVLEKRRTLVRFEGHLWEVDCFEGATAGLVVAEIELSAEDEQFVRPPWLGSEVTRQAAYYNSALTARPYSTWGALGASSGCHFAAAEVRRSHPTSEMR